MIFRQPKYQHLHKPNLREGGKKSNIFRTQNGSNLYLIEIHIIMGIWQMQKGKFKHKMGVDKVFFT